MNEKNYLENLSAEEIRSIRFGVCNNYYIHQQAKDYYETDKNKGRIVDDYFHEYEKETVDDYFYEYKKAN